MRGIGGRVGTTSDKYKKYVIMLSLLLVICDQKAIVVTKKKEIICLNLYFGMDLCVVVRNNVNIKRNKEVKFLSNENFMV